MQSRLCSLQTTVEFQKLRTLDLLVADMHSNCNEAEAQLQVTNEVCNSLLARAASLRAERSIPPSCPGQTRLTGTQKCCSEQAIHHLTISSAIYSQSR